MFDFLTTLLLQNGLHSKPYIEPFAGGSGLALKLLCRGYVSRVILNDYDYRLYSFWSTLFTENERLIDWLNSVEVTVNNWDYYKYVLSEYELFSKFEVASATFFLNRTNRSGILSGGIIGGRDQKGKWKMDVRFNKERLIKIISYLGTFSSKVRILNQDASALLKSGDLPNEGLIFFDPPYYEKGPNLYLNSLDTNYHIEFSQLLLSSSFKYWLLTYDDNDFIRSLYSNLNRHKMKDIFVGTKTHLAKELLFMSNDLKLSL